MEILFFTIGFLLGMIVVWFFMNKNLKIAENKTSIETQKNIKLSTELENFIKNQENFDVHIKESIESYVLNAMQLNNENFINLSQKTLEKYFVEADKGLQNKTLEIEKIIAPLHKTLESYSSKVSDFQENTSKDLGSLTTYLKELSAMQNELSKQTSSLVGALKSPKVRGRWGEIGLRRIVEFSGLNEYCDFSEQTMSDTDQLRPDMIIHLPESRKIIVDSKLPLEAYLLAVEADNEQNKKDLLEHHLKAVKETIRRLSAKNYRQKFSNSIDFVVMYIEIEPALTAALSLDTNLINLALQKNIIIATPTTFVALLQTVAYGWKQFKLSENAQLILKETKIFYSRISVFTQHFQKIGKSISNLDDEFNKAIGSWNNRIEPSIKRIKKLGIDDNLLKINKTDE